MIDFDSRLGQLAIARGILSLGDLLSTVEEAGRTGRTVSDVLLLKGLMSHSEIESLAQDLEETDLNNELERGATIVLEALHKSMVEEPIPAGIGTQHTLEMEIEETDLSLSHESRYEVRSELGRGGMGRVFLARDKILQRDIAMKTLIESRSNEAERGRLLIEARVTGLLEHPSIVPVYDLRAMRGGEPFYTMRVVQEKSLEELIREMRRGETAHSFTSLVSVLRQVSLAVEFAHGLGVIHRDLKPENILVGKYGEVYVIDWGVAKIVSTEIGLESTGRGNVGQLVGTPMYMSPEQARGDNDNVNELSDVYALGAILYEILTLDSMFHADHVLAILFQVVHDPPERPSERAPSRGIPKDLEEICLRALQKDPSRRYRSAQEFADELELFLDGVKERERHHELAEEALLQATQVRAVYEEVRSQYSLVAAELTKERDRVESWSPPEEKRELWSLEQQAEDLEVEIERRFGEVIRTYSQALVHVPEMTQAREALAELYWERFRENEATGRLAQAAYFEGLVRQYNDGSYDDLLEGTAYLSLNTAPPSASATVYRFQQVDRRLVEWRIADVGPTPVADLSLPHGSYLLEIESSGHTPVVAPVVVDRGSRRTVDVRMYPEGVVPEGFAVVPAGSFISGKITPGAPVTTQHLPDYAISKLPVTVSEYLEFLNALVAEGRDEAALSHAPLYADTHYFQRSEDGGYVLPEADPEGDSWQPDWPMFLVNFNDADAYAKWFASKHGRPFRLPTVDEWEKAARGVDGRTYSWGNHFDASYCCMRDSRKGRSHPTVVGSFAIDRSPYGVMDMCGNVAEWTSSVEVGSKDVHYLGGASYNSFAELCRLDFMFSSPTVHKGPHYGFRLALSLDE